MNEIKIFGEIFDKKVIFSKDNKYVITILEHKYDGVKYKGVASLHDDDKEKYNEDFGRKLSYLRAKKLVQIYYKNKQIEHCDYIFKVLNQNIKELNLMKSDIESTSSKIKDLLK